MTMPSRAYNFVCSRIFIWKTIENESSVKIDKQLRVFFYPVNIELVRGMKIKGTVSLIFYCPPVSKISLKSCHFYGKTNQTSPLEQS